MVGIGLSYGVVDFGTTNAIITKKVTKANYNALQLFNVMLSILVFFIIFLAIKYDLTTETGETFQQALFVLALATIIYSLTIVPYARMHKALKLKRLAAVDFIPVSTFLLSVPMMLMVNLNLLAFAYATLIQVSTRLLILSLFYRHRPSASGLSKIPYQRLLQQYASNFTLYVTSKADQLMVAAFLGKEPLGLYSFLKQVLSYPISILVAIYTQITFPFFARYRNSSEKVKSSVLKSVLFIMSLLLLYFSVLILIPEESIQSHIPMWDFLNPLALSIMFFSIVKTANDMVSAMSVAVGLIGRQLSANIIFLVLSVISALPTLSKGLTIEYVLILSFILVGSASFIYSMSIKSLRHE